MDSLGNNIDYDQSDGHFVVAHEKFVDSPRDHRRSGSEERQEIQKSDQKRHQHEIPCSEGSQSYKQDHKHDTHDLELGLKISAYRIPQIIHHESHPLLHRLRSHFLHPAKHFFPLYDEEVSRQNGYEESDQIGRHLFGDISRCSHRRFADAGHQIAHVFIQVLDYRIPAVLNTRRQPLEYSGECVSDLSQPGFQLCIHLREILDQ